MTDRIKPLSHVDADKKTDEQLAHEAGDYITHNPSIQVICELMIRLREMELPWWTPKHLRNTYSASDRMRWLRDRADLRQKITTALTGLAPKACRKKAPDFQAALLDSVIDDGDIDVEQFERSFEPLDLVVYGPVGDFWRLFRRRMPWDDDATAHQDLVGWLIGALLSDKSILDGAPRKPVLSALDVRTAIDGRVWHTRIPLDVRVAIDEARFELEKKSKDKPFHADRDLVVAAPALIAASIPLKDLTRVFDVASRAMGFEDMVPDVARGSVAPPEGSRPGSMPPPRGEREPAPAGDDRRPAIADESTLVGSAMDSTSTGDEAPGEDGAGEDGDPPLAGSGEHAGGSEDEMEQTNPWASAELNGLDLDSLLSPDGDEAPESSRSPGGAGRTSKKGRRKKS